MDILNLVRSRKNIFKYITILIYFSAGRPSNSLLKVFLNVLTNQDCNLYYSKEEKLSEGIGLGQICAIDPQFKMDTCQVMYQ